MNASPDGARLFYPRCKAILSIVLDGYDDGPGSEDEPISLSVLPKAATIHGNGYHQADSWELRFDYMDLPFDPQLIRAGAVEIYLSDATAVRDDLFATSRQYNFREGGKTVVMKTASGVGISRTEFVGDAEPQIAGTFNTASLSFSDDGKWAALSGQDYTEILIKTQWPPRPNGTAKRLPVGDRLDRWAEKIIAEADPGHSLAVKVRDVDPASLPIVKAENIAHKRGIPVQQNTSYWDVLYKVCTRYGFICYVKGLSLVITKPKNLDDIAEHDIKHLSWGRNISHLELTRNLGKEKVPRVVIHAYDDRDGSLKKIEEPEGGAKRKAAVMSKDPAKRTSETIHIKATAATTAAKKPKVKTERLTDEYIIVPVYGISDEAALRRAAKMMRTLIGRGERKIVVKTRDLVDDNDAGLLWLGSGDAFEIHWQDFNQEVLGDEGLTMEARIRHLTDRGFQRQVAQAIASGYQRLIGKQAPLRLREWTYDYEVGSGIDIEAELVDFVVVDGVRDHSMTPVQEVDGILRKLGFGMGKATQ